MKIWKLHAAAVLFNEVDVAALVRELQYYELSDGLVISVETEEIADESQRAWRLRQLQVKKT